jgi:nitrogen fixation protein FixH
MLVIMLAFFSVIIAVNATMAVFANSSWSGFVVRNSYVASQEFNEKSAQWRAQAELGWASKLALTDGRISYQLFDRDDLPVAAVKGTVSVRRPIGDSEDRTLPLKPVAGGELEADTALRDGAWIAEFEIDAGLDQPYREIRRLTVRDGELR